MTQLDGTKRPADGQDYFSTVSYGWPEWVEYVTPDMISRGASDATLHAGHPCRSPLGWLYYWFKVGIEHKRAEATMRKLLGLSHYWAEAPRIQGCISSLLLWEIRAKQYLTNAELAAIVNATAAALGYNQYFDYYESEEPDRGSQTCTPTRPAAAQATHQSTAPAAEAQSSPHHRRIIQANAVIREAAYAALKNPATPNRRQDQPPVAQPERQTVRIRPKPRRKDATAMPAPAEDQPPVARHPVPRRPVGRKPVLRRRPLS